MTAGNRIYLRRPSDAEPLLEAFRRLPAAVVADCMSRLPALSAEISLKTAPKTPIMCGLAVTVKARSGDNLMLHKALDMAGPNDVIILSNEGDRSQSLMGEVMATYARQRGMEGIVLDGPVRDIEGLSRMDFPIYAAGHTPGGPFKDGPGEINVPIACGKIHVSPGDIVLGDADGVIVIPRQDAARILEAAQAYLIVDEHNFELAKTGSLERGWLAEALQNKQVEIIDDVYR
ncbi:RraA family protein [Pantoea sp. EABMAA-21]|jgi:Demethylmenaquinone methyltransferase|uniref:Putative 4-hydroxy-4-methyl-2-oxoglutarate aldolase n=1 Tax=Candidatus Pantoea formicae TaxID=2608355 RepID=A0ABX0R088_9GAMM|nr:MULTISPECIES: RraA family protein [Pantoea]MDF7647305.1 RraA family protein [Erwiniaceae bacterium L1_54_3]MDI9279876.1 RraA family protein [Pantoea sp. EABMAA-21]MXP55270.1 RraA family protein [Pantoea sp. Seng]MXP59417.1 RraA family protein [Pantoea sp. Taur]NIF01345.1 RraA family protein [Pantoea formicae]